MTPGLPPRRGWGAVYLSPLTKLSYFSEPGGIPHNSPPTRRFFLTHARRLWYAWGMWWRFISNAPWTRFKDSPGGPAEVLEAIIDEPTKEEALARLERDDPAWRNGHAEFVGESRPPPSHRRGFYVGYTPDPKGDV